MRIRLKRVETNGILFEISERPFAAHIIGGTEMSAQFREIAFLKALFIALCAAVIGTLACGGDDKIFEPLPTSSEAAFEEALWRDPPIEYRPYVRGWWPGGDVNDEELKRELALLHGAGFGGAEIFPLLFGLSSPSSTDISRV